MFFFHRDKKPRIIEDHRPIEWEWMDGPNGALAAGANLTATPYGNVGRNIGYDVWLTQEDLDTMDFDERLYCQTLIEMQRDSAYYRARLNLNYTEKHLWPHGGKPIISSGNWAWIFHHTEE